MSKIRIALFGSALNAAWFLSRKARELIDHHLIKAGQICLVFDTTRMLQLIASSLAKHKIPFKKIENVRITHKEACILAGVESLCNVQSYLCDYWFALLCRPLKEKRVDFAKRLKDQTIREAYLTLCFGAQKEGDELNYLLGGEISPEGNWRNPGVVYFQKENDRWRSYWQGTPRWMVPEMLVRIADELALCQERFLEQGFSAMAPLTMHEVAFRVGFHESSVSRIIAGLDAETPWGRIALKSFFSAKIGSKFGFTSQISILGQLLKIIENENKVKPLTDQQISKLMRQKGINISRRTITKYRQRLRIASTRHRNEVEMNGQSELSNVESKNAIPLDRNDIEYHRSEVPLGHKGERKQKDIEHYAKKKNESATDTPRTLTIGGHNDAESCIQLGKIYEINGEYAKAIEQFEKAISFNPDDGRAYLSAGLNYERIGRRERAISYYRLAIKLGNNEAIDFLRSMGIE